MCATCDTPSLVCERDATTIEPLVNGQQLIASPCAGAGSMTCVNSRLKGSLAATECFRTLCLALQHACEFIAADIPAIGCSLATADESASLIEARA